MLLYDFSQIIITVASAIKLTRVRYLNTLHIINV